ncbi:hypothetical protein SC1_03456 [Sphingopyxis sp. C-1]|nr:hypothetical protein SC1_03456 [Sphingopyxis sp. C-1]
MTHSISKKAVQTMLVHLWIRNHVRMVDRCMVRKSYCYCEE